MQQRSTALIAPILIVACSVAQAETFTVPAEVGFADIVAVSDAVRNECTLQTRLPEFIKDGARGDVDIVISDEPLDNVAGKVLRLEYVNILGAGGGAWSGPKSATVSGELWENGELIGSFVASRYSRGGAFGGFKGTCSILGRCIRTLGVDIARWLGDPTMDARLGNA
ncbi:hypothetical protein [Candidatus Rariloculus sp.]|uniref:hypothetical protein n=1 Tax=Candidatus Rariloculus sp. TaxID=3101265 RepID=UPI003D0EECE5